MLGMVVGTGETRIACPVMRGACVTVFAGFHGLSVTSEYSDIPHTGSGTSTRSFASRGRGSIGRSSPAMRMDSRLSVGDSYWRPFESGRFVGTGFDSDPNLCSSGGHSASASFIIIPPEKYEPNHICNAV